MDIKVELKEGAKTTTYSVKTEPTEKAIKAAIRFLGGNIKNWVNETVTKETKEDIFK